MAAVKTLRLWSEERGGIDKKREEANPMRCFHDSKHKNRVKA